MKLGFLVNPFLLFPFAFLFLIGMYSLEWSDLFPKLEFNTYVFIVLTSIMFFAIGFVVKKIGLIKYFDLPERNINKHNPLFVVFFMILLFVLDVLYSGTIPFLAGNIEAYETFGMPIVDPLILSLIIFYSIYWFHAYLTTKKKSFCFLFFLTSLCVF